MPAKQSGLVPEPVEGRSVRREETVLVIAPDPQLRRSIAFLLEAEGLPVTSCDKVPGVAAQASRRRCAVIDEDAATLDPMVWREVSQAAESVVVLLDRSRTVPKQFLARAVYKPLLGEHLVSAVRIALSANGSDREGT